MNIITNLPIIIILEIAELASSSPTTGLNEFEI